MSTPVPPPLLQHPAHVHTLQRVLFWVAALTCALMLLTVGLSAFIRLAQSPQVCKQWLSCASAAATPEHTIQALVPMARQAHRVVASALLALTLVLALGTGSLQPAHGRQHPLWPALGMLALGVGLAALGIVGRSSTATAVMLGNLLGGLLMFSLSWLLVLALHPRPACASARGPGRRATNVCWLLALLAVWLQAIAGAWLSIQPAFAGHALVHVWGGVLVAGLSCALAWMAWQDRRSKALWLLPALGLLQCMLGLALAPPALLVAWTHNLFTALMLALLTGWRPAS